MVATATHANRSASQRKHQNSVRPTRTQAAAAATARSRSADSQQGSTHRAPPPSHKEPTTPSKRVQPNLKKVPAPRDSSLLSRQIRGQAWGLAERPWTEARRINTRSPVEWTLTLSGFVVATLLVLAFGLDLATGWPFHRYSLLMDVGYSICAALLMYMSWNTYQDLR